MDGRAPDGADTVEVAEFCALLQTVARRPPRLSRDLEPDLIGADLKGRILEALIAAPPAPDDFEAGLLECADALDLPAGATRGVCSDILAEWQMAHATPAFLPWLRAASARRTPVVAVAARSATGSRPGGNALSAASACRRRDNLDRWHDECITAGHSPGPASRRRPDDLAGNCGPRGGRSRAGPAISW